MSVRDQRGKVIPTFRGAFQGPDDEFNGTGVRPLVFDIVGPDGVTSVLPSNLRMVLEANPSSVGFNYQKVIERTQTRGGYVEQHWGDGLTSISLNMTTGGFKRLYSGLSNVTGGGISVGGTRRETIQYDKYLDMLALFHNNGAIRDNRGQIVFAGRIKITFDGGTYFGWFDQFNVTEAAEKPFLFTLTTQFTVDEEILRLHSLPVNTQPQSGVNPLNASLPQVGANPHLEGRGRPT